MTALHFVGGCIVWVTFLCSAAAQVSAGESSPLLERVDVFAKALTPPGSGSLLFAGVFRQDQIGASDREACRRAFAGNPKAEELISVLDAVPNDAALQGKLDNATIQELAFAGDGSYYLHKYTGGGTVAQSAGNTDWKYYANGKRVLAITSAVGGPSQAVIADQPLDALEQVWMKGLASDLRLWAQFLAKHGTKTGQVISWQPSDGPPLSPGLKMPIWHRMVARVVLSLDHRPETEVSILNVSMMGFDGTELLTRRCVLVDGELVRVSCLAWLPGTGKLYSVSEAVRLQGACDVPLLADSLSAATNLAYIVDSTDRNRRIYFEGGVPEDFLALPALKAVSAGVDMPADARPERRDIEVAGIKPMPLLEFFPKHLHLGALTSDAWITCWLVNSGGSPVRILDAGPSCGCLDLVCPPDTIRAHGSIALRLHVRHNELSRDRAYETLHFVCDGSLGKGLYSVNVLIDKASAKSEDR